MNREKLKEKLWEELKKLKLGQTISYSELSKKVGMEEKTRFISSLLKENPYLISIPCHRVVRKNGELGNYVLGENFKKFLLDWERSFWKND